MALLLVVIVVVVETGKEAEAMNGKKKWFLDNHKKKVETTRTAEFFSERTQQLARSQRIHPFFMKEIRATNPDLPP